LEATIPRLDEGGEKASVMGRELPENSLAALREAMVHADGIEFDLRMTLDGHLVFHHDRTPMIPTREKRGGPTYVEAWTLDELREFGAETFDDMLADTTISTAWREQAKVGVIEIKRPHPRHTGRGWWNDDRRDLEHMSTMAAKVDSALNEAEIPVQNTVLYAFHPRMPDLVKTAGWSRPWSRLTPNLPPYGSGAVQRALAAPSFVRNSFARLVRTHRSAGSPMMPCALDYLHGMRRYVPLGRSVGLTGRALQRLKATLEGFPAYVWPAPYRMEATLIDAGLSLISDSVTDPRVRHVDGRLRWKRMATAPLEGGMPSVGSDEEARSMLKQLDAEVAPWHELDTEAHRRHLDIWRKRWGWKRGVDELMADVGEGGNTMPWESVRMIGHRGAGKTPRPVLHRVAPQT